MDASAANAITGRAPLRASGTLRSALKKRGKSTGTLSYFYSAKNDRDIVLATDLELCSALDLEADESVRSFDIDAARIAAVMEGHSADHQPDVLVVRRDGSMCLRHVGYRTAQRSSRAQKRQQDRAAIACETEIAREWFNEETVRLLGIDAPRICSLHA